MAMKRRREKHASFRSPVLAIALAALIGFSSVAVLAAGEKKSSKKEEKVKKVSQKTLIAALDPRYQAWLDLVSYIIQPMEKKIFLELTNDRDRDMFVELFWSLRDPIPGTPENEFKQEHIRRFNYANQYYKYGAGRPGWMTDMGRITILLGEPDSKDRYENDNVVVPTQVWSYSGKGRPGLPNAFWVVFFKRSLVGEYKVYNPLSDGPYSLLLKLPSMATADNDYEGIYENIADRHPVLAMAAVSLLPDEPSPDFRPTLKSELLLGDIYNLPSRSINANYATSFLKYKGQVKVDYSMNYIENVSTAHVLRDPVTGLHFIHFAILPKVISIEQLKEKNEDYFNFNLDVSLKSGEETVFSYQKNFPFFMRAGEAEQKFAAGVILSDYFPVVEGEYELRILAQNDVKKEFTYFERKVVIKPDTQAAPVLYGPLLSYEVKKVPRPAFLPFKVGDGEWTINPRSEFGSGDAISVLAGIDRGPGSMASELRVEIEDLNDPKKFSRAYPATLQPGEKISYRTLEVGTLPTGNYRIRLRAVGPSGVTLAVTESTFMVSLQVAVPRPPQAFKITSADNLFRFYHILGFQYLSLGKLDQAQANMEKAFELKPDYPNLIKDYAALLQKKKSYDRILEIVEGLKARNETLFDYYAIRGKAFYYKGDVDPAIESLQKANSIYDSNIEVLNILGLCYLKQGNRAEAKKVFESSLKVFPDQKEIIELLKKL